MSQPFAAIRHAILTNDNRGYLGYLADIVICLHDSFYARDRKLGSDFNVLEAQPTV